MEFILIFLLASIGACVGSFVNVIADRLPRGESVLFSRSHCENCKKKLGAFEMIPIFSYLAIQGKCIKCHARIPVRVFVVEFVSAVLYVILLLLFLYSLISLPFLIYLLVVAPILIAVFLADVTYGIIPDELVIALTLVSAIFLSIFMPDSLVNHTLTALASFSLFFALFSLTGGRGMGFGDVKLAAALGLMLGFPNIVVGLYGAFLTGAAVSIILIIWRKKKLRGDTIPFGPFLVLSSFLAIFLGEAIAAYFLKLI